MGIIKREWRVVKRGEDYSLRRVDVADDRPTGVARFQPGGFQMRATGKNLPDLYEDLLKGARREIEEAFELPLVEVS